MRIKLIWLTLIPGVLGILLNNYAFLHDLFWGKGVITMGALSGSVAAVGGVVAVSSLIVLFFLLRSQPPSPRLSFSHAVFRDRRPYLAAPRSPSFPSAPSLLSRLFRRRRVHPIRPPASQQPIAPPPPDGPVSAYPFAVGLVVLTVPLAVFLAVLVHPLASPLEETALTASRDGIVRADGQPAAIKLPGAANQMLRFLSLKVSLQLPPRQPGPVRFDIRGGDPNGRSLASTYLWNPEPEPGSQTMNLTYFSWFNNTSYLVSSSPPGSAQPRIDEIVVSDYLQILQTNQKPFLHLLVVIGGLICIILVPGSLIFALTRNRLRHYFTERRRRRISYAVLGAVAALSVVEAWYVIATVYLPEFSFSNGVWTAFDIGVATTSNDPFPLRNYAPGRYFFFAVVISFLKAVGFSATHPMVTEIGYRVVQFAIAITANIFLFFYLIKLWKRLGLPGPYFFPHIAFAILSLYPELVFTYLSANVHTGMFFPIFILIWLFAFRIIYEDQSWKGILLLGLTFSFALLWRNELRFIPFAVILLIMFAMGVNRRNALICAKTLVVASVIPLAVMSKNYFAYDTFVLHDSSQISLAPSTYAGQGYQENAQGFLFDDCYVSSVAIRTAPDIDVGKDEYRKNAMSIYFGYVFKHPVEFARSVLYRMPHNFYSLPSNVLPNAGNAGERISAFITGSDRSRIWLLLILNLAFVAFAFLKGRKEIVFLSLPALYALYVVGVAASGVGYFPYVYLTFAVIFTLGLASAFHFAVCVFARLLKLTVPVIVATEDMAHQKAFFGAALPLSGLMVAFAAWQGVGQYSPVRHLPTWSDSRMVQNVLDGMFLNNAENAAVRIKWGISSFPTNTVPYYDGHVVEVDGDVLMESLFGGSYLFRLVDPETGATKVRFTNSHVIGCVEGYFAKHGTYLYTERSVPMGRPVLERINLRDLDDRTAFEMKGQAYSPLLVDDRRIYYQAAGIQEFLDPVAVPLPPSSASGKTSTQGWRFAKVPTWGELAQSECCLFFGSLKGGLFFAVDKESGQEKWRFTGKANATMAPYVTGPSVIFVDATGNIYELEAEDGSLIHEASLSGRFLADIEYAEGVVYLGNLSGDTFAVDLASGDVLWETAGRGAVLAKPLLQNGYLYVASGRWLSKLDAASGEPVWEIDLGYVVRDTPLILDGNILVRTTRYLVALEEIDGR